MSASKRSEWEAWTVDLTGPRKNHFDDMNARHGLTAHQAYLQETPDGNYLVLVNHEGAGGDSFLESMASSDHEFDRWFMERIAYLHDMDLSGPPPPMPVRKL